MYKRLIIGDIHGIGVWKDIYDKENPDEVICLGDYFDSYNLDSLTQKINFDDLLDCKERHNKTRKYKFITLMGNHDFHYWTDCSEQYSGHNKETQKLIGDGIDNLIDRNELPIVYVDKINKIVFSHAGISQSWFEKHVMTELSAINTCSLKALIFTYAGGGDWYGSSELNSPIWIRPEGLLKHPYKDWESNTWNQIYGHTNIIQPTIIHNDDAFFINMDCLNKGYYLVQYLDVKGKLIKQNFGHI